MSEPVNPPSLPPPSPTDAQALVLRGIEAIEGLRGKVAAIEKATDGNSDDLDSIKASVLRVEGLLSRIATAEEKRTTLAEKAEDRRDAWLSRLWASKPAQLIFFAIALALANLLGQHWEAENVVKTLPVISGGP